MSPRRKPFDFFQENPSLAFKKGEGKLGFKKEHLETAQDLIPERDKSNTSWEEKSRGVLERKDGN